MSGARCGALSLVVALLAGCGDAADADAVDAADAATAGDDDAGDAGDTNDDGADAEVEGDGHDATGATARDLGPAVPASLATALEEVLAAHFAEVGSAGLAVGVRTPEGAWWEGVVGEGCHEPATAVVRGDRFRLGSITKTWVAAAVLQLVDEGAVDLDAPIATYVPGFDLDAGVTVRRCLSHTTGIFDLVDDPLSVRADLTKPIAPEEIVRQSLEHAPDFAPGEGWEYSNTNFFLLGLLVEHVTGAPLAQVLRERFLAPLGLVDTFLEDAEPATTTFVCGNLSTLDVTNLLDMSWSWAAGAMVSSNADLCLWAEALWRGDVLPAPLREAMVAPTVLPDGDTVRYGLGTMLRTRGGVPLVGHNGQTLGFQSELFIDPVSGTCVSVLANDFSAVPEAVGVPVWELLVPTLGLAP